MLSRVLLPVLVSVLLLLTLSPEGAHAGFGSRRAALRARARQEAADRLRRGFQNSALATARGFGKRGDPALRESASAGAAEGEMLMPVPQMGRLAEGTRVDAMHGDGIPVEEVNQLAKLIEATRKANNRNGGESWMALVNTDKRADSPSTLKQSNSNVERYPVSMVSELVSSSPALATSLVARFLDTDEDGFVTPKELLGMM